MYNSFYHNAEILKKIIEKQIKTGTLEKFLEDILKKPIKEVRIQGYRYGKKTDPNFFCIPITVEETSNKITNIGLLLVEKHQILNTTLKYWTYFFEQKMKTKDIRHSQMVSNKLRVVEANKARHHDVIYLGIEDALQKTIQQEIEMHCIGMTDYVQEIEEEDLLYLKSFLPILSQKMLLIAIELKA